MISGGLVWIKFDNDAQRTHVTIYRGAPDFYEAPRLIIVWELSLSFTQKLNLRSNERKIRWPIPWPRYIPKDIVKRVEYFPQVE